MSAKKRDPRIGRIEKNFLVGFLQYLQNDYTIGICKKNIRHLSAGTQKQYQLLLATILNVAVKEDIIASNPFCALSEKETLASPVPDLIDDFDYEDNGHVCVFKIPAATNQPVSFLHEEYVRVGSTTRKLRDFPQKEAKIWKGGQKALEKIVVKEKLTVTQVLSLLSVETYFDMMKLPLPTDTIGIIDRMLAEKIVIQDEVGYSITELGALLFAKHLSDFDDMRRKMVRVIVYKGKSKLDIVREQSFDAGYAISFKTMVEWINSQLPANEEIM